MLLIRLLEDSLGGNRSAPHGGSSGGGGGGRRAVSFLYDTVHHTCTCSCIFEVTFFLKCVHQCYLKGKFSSGREGALASKFNYDFK